MKINRMNRFLPVAFIFLIFMMTLKSNNKVIKSNLDDWRKRQEKIRKYCDSEKAILLKRNKFASERLFQKKLMENIVHVDSLNVNWCLGKMLLKENFLFRNQN